MRHLTTIYIMWLRDIKRFLRSPSRIIGNITMPILILISLGAGFGKAAIPGIEDKNLTFLGYLVPGMAGMSILFSGIFSGFSVLWDRQYGFLKEIMVAPVSRIAIVLGRISSATTVGVIQALFVIFVAQLFGFQLTSILSLLPAVVMMILISFIFTGIGLAFASRMKDDQGFGLVMNFLIMPLLFLSGAFAPINNLPGWVKVITYFDPLTYGIDGLRGILLGVSSMPIGLDFAVSAGLAVLFVVISAWLFETSEVV